MSAQLIDGRTIADELKTDVAREIEQLAADHLGCGLATVAVGDDSRSGAYERRLTRIAAELGVHHHRTTLAASSTESDVVAEVRRLGADPAITGILVLRPLPDHIREAPVFQALPPIKDIEAVHPENAGLLALGSPRYVPSTAASVFHVLDRWLDETGRNRADFYHRSLIVVVGRSNNVGKPAVSLAYERGAAVASVDEWASRTDRLGWHTRRADVLVVAAGVPHLIRAEHIRAGAVVLDVGIHLRTGDSTGRARVVGDVDTDDVRPRAAAVTPVPGGIGPVTDVWLLRNTVTASRRAAARSASTANGTPL